jgi:hypothetical protein
MKSYLKRIVYKEVRRYLIYTLSLILQSRNNFRSNRHSSSMKGKMRRKSKEGETITTMVKYPLA